MRSIMYNSLADNWIQECEHMFDYRKIADLEPFHKIAEFSFSVDERYRSSVRNTVRNSLTIGSEVWGAYDNSTLAAGYVLDEYTMRFRNSMVKMGGIGFVCTRIDYRGKGAVKFLMKGSLKTMHEKGHAVSVLYPFNQSFYRKYGWEQFYRVRKIKLSPEHFKLPESDDSITTELLDHPDQETISFYNDYARRHYNYCLRTMDYWNMFMSNPWPDLIARYIVKFSEKGKVIGLMDLSYVKEGKERKSVLSIRPLIYETEEARRSMLAFVKRLSQQIEEVAFMIPMDEELWPYLSDRPKEQTIDDFGMIRVVSVEQLDGLAIGAPDLELGIKLNDSLAPWNDGIFSLKVQSGRLEVSRSQEYDIECDVATLSSVLSGFTNLREMYACGRVKTTHDVLNVDLPKETTLLMEFF